MPASLVKDELARLCRPDLEKLLGCGGSKRRENILMLMCNRQLSGVLCPSLSSPESAQRR